MKDTPESVARIVAEMRERATDDRQHGEPDQQLEAWADELESLTPTPQAAPASPATGDWFADTLAAAGEVIPLDAELPGMWERADLIGGATDAAEAQAAPGGEAWPSVDPGYSALFNAIAAATSVYAGGAGAGVSVSVTKFREALATHPARSEAAPDDFARGVEFGRADERASRALESLDAAPLPAQVDEGKRDA